MRIGTKQELLSRQLADALALEQSAYALLHWLHDAATGEEVRELFGAYAECCGRQVADLERVGHLVGYDEPPPGSPVGCSLISEAVDLVQSTSARVRDEAILAAGLQLEHLQLAAYESLIAIAEGATQPEARVLLERGRGQTRAASDELASAMRPGGRTPPP